MEKELKVRMISYSKPTEEMRSSGIESAQELIAFCARVSNPSNQYNKETSEKLIRYLIKHQHWSPLELASACLEITTTRDIARQILRHRSFSFNEFSQRYADPTKELDFVLRDARLQDEKNRQNSIDTDDTQLKDWWDAQQKFLIDNVRRIYAEAIERGIAKEQARVILPEGNTVSRLYMNGTLRSWVHYCELRMAHGTQKEHMDVAKEIANVISECFPMMENLFDE